MKPIGNWTQPEYTYFPGTGSGQTDSGATLAQTGVITLTRTGVITPITHSDSDSDRRYSDRRYYSDSDMDYIGSDRRYYSDPDRRYYSSDRGILDPYRSYYSDQDRRYYSDSDQRYYSDPDRLYYGSDRHSFAGDEFRSAGLHW